MPKKLNRVKHLSRYRDKSPSFSALLDAIDPERKAQQQEYQRRLNETTQTISQPKPKKKPQKPQQVKSTGVSFEEKLKSTQAWLQETFPILFDPSEPPKPLDIHIVRDIKAHYKQYQLLKKYPSDLVIKAALYRYMESPEYLKCLVKGASRYNMEGQISGSV